MRTPALAASLAVCTFASASFDLLLLPGADQRIYSHDPINNVALGSYGADVVNLVSHDSNGRSYAGSSSSATTTVQNFNTGELHDSLSFVGLRSTEVNSTSYYGVTSSMVRRYSAATGANLGSNNLNSAGSWYSLTTFGTRLQVVGINPSTNSVLVTTGTLGLGLGGMETLGVQALAGSTIGKAAVGSNSTQGVHELAFTYVNSSGTLILASLGLDASGSTTELSPSSINISSSFSAANFMPAVLRSHSGILVVGQDATTSSLMRIQLYATGLGGQNRILSYTITAPGGGFGTISTGVYQPSNVVAPEPGSMVALGLGALALLRRRRLRD